jgi:hypothetical protein
VEEVQPHPGRSRWGEGPRHGHLPLRDPGREADLPGPPQTEGGQEGEGLAGPPPLLRRVRPHPCLSPPLLPPRPQGALAPPQVNLAESFNSPGEEEVREVPLPLGDRIARAIALNYNLSTCYLILVIILQGPSFLRDVIKYIQ